MGGRTSKLYMYIWLDDGKLTDGHLNDGSFGRRTLGQKIWTSESQYSTNVLI